MGVSVSMGYILLFNSSAKVRLIFQIAITFSWKFFKNFITPHSPPTPPPQTSLKTTLGNHEENPRKSRRKPSEITKKTLGNHEENLRKSRQKVPEITAKSSRNHRDFLQKLP